MTKTLYTDGDWSLKCGPEPYRTYPPEEEEMYWLSHRHDDEEEFGVRGIYPAGAVIRTISTPCFDCKSVCPPGLQGMFLVLTKL